ncbi:hypothetical protein TSUD_340670 [Trifolium subterraneum]|uniref:C2 NT-type domain-containing protein n=1 Tax=Trifolium subterraneum TaxID=3900 RepID=A0A2Z6LJE2_TRISU|nr:hypothetical protein TSUD_340670 [Trifolium subterraneum]
MMRWRPWQSSLVTKNYHIKWKSSKSTLASFGQGSDAMNFTKDAAIYYDEVEEGFIVNFDEQFQKICNLNCYKKDNVFLPWEIALNLFNGLNEKTKKKGIVIGTALLNIAEFANSSDQIGIDLNIPFTIPGVSAQNSPSLNISISLVELSGAQEKTQSIQRSIVPVSSPLAESRDSTLTEKGDLSSIKAGLRKVKMFKDFVSSRKSPKMFRGGEGSSGYGKGSSDGKCSRTSGEATPNYSLDSDSLHNFKGDSDEGNEDSSVRNSFSYGTLAVANAGGSSYYSNTKVNCDDDDWVYYSYHMPDIRSELEKSSVSSSGSYLSQSKKRSILPWKKRKLGFSSKGVRGEPLLKKDYAEDGGDDIDFDRRQLSSDESYTPKFLKTGENGSLFSEFGDDMFIVGSWEQKEITSRDGHMKLDTQVFFASIDQRSERAAGESACTALVAVIADWFQNYHDLMPLKSQFDSLIREGSSEWRNLRENETYRNQFPDGHFDLETVLEAKIRPLSIVPDKSFIGFFHPEGMDEERFEFLRGSMSFDNIWDEISGSEHDWLNNGKPHVFIVSWNDHFFILKVESDCYYIIDTLGERLYEGCNQAYILKFDSNTVIHRTQNVAPSSSSSNDKAKNNTKPQTIEQILPQNKKPAKQVNDKLNDKANNNMKPLTIEQILAQNKAAEQVSGNESDSIEEKKEEIVCRGREACKEYIKNFLAAIPIRQLQVDMATNNGTFSLHQRLQIEFHYTQLLPSCISTTSEVEATMAAAETLALAINEIST